MLGAGCWVLDAGYWILGAGCWMLDAGYWILDAGCWMLDAGYSMLNARNSGQSHEGGINRLEVLIILTQPG
jgi:hypothetical protein